MFKFRLQRVLELREKREQARAIELAKAEEIANVARTQRDEIEALHTASRMHLATAHTAAPTVGHLNHLGYVLSALDVRLGHAAKSVSTAEGKVSTARQSLEDAARDRRVLDRLKDKHQGVYRTEEGARDRMAMDEIALARFTRMREVQSAGASAPSNESTSKASAGNGANSKTPDGVTDA